MHIGDQWMKWRSLYKDLSGIFVKPFPVGVKYYRPPRSTEDCWDEDFCRPQAERGCGTNCDDWQ